MPHTGCQYAEGKGAYDCGDTPIGTAHMHARFLDNKAWVNVWLCERHMDECTKVN